MPDDKNSGIHVSEIGEWTPEVEEEISGMKLDNNLVVDFWSIPKARAEENENA